ncbi:MAG TPA: hypothetical protein ENL26_01065 [Kosmotoga arenicorallina]|uniref:SHOCT domain-containing protein n=1 Tax=Kosmotoga arenicorallina TaxID=688066 RepID=A0A7C5HWG6_9BACT|nr:hypothetical protein [Kosmotoga arenicorallina]
MHWGFWNPAGCWAWFSGWGWFGPIFGLILMVLFFAVFFWIIKRVVGTGSRTKTVVSNRDSEALRILELRYAKGKISDEEYKKMRKQLGGES